MCVSETTWYVKAFNNIRHFKGSPWPQVLSSGPIGPWPYFFEEKNDNKLYIQFKLKCVCVCVYYRQYIFYIYMYICKQLCFLILRYNKNLAYPYCKDRVLYSFTFYLLFQPLNSGLSFKKSLFIKTLLVIFINSLLWWTPMDFSPYPMWLLNCLKYFDHLLFLKYSIFRYIPQT